MTPSTEHNRPGPWKKLPRLAALTATLLCASACVETNFADAVSMNVARLTVMNADAAITSLINDPNCGFDSSNVTTTILEGTPPGEGVLQHSIENCEIHFTEPTVTSTNCHDGIQTVAYGRVFFPSATVQIAGTLLPSEDTPIIPQGPSSVTISAEVEFDNWEAADTDQAAYMVWVDGSLRGTLRPRMAGLAAGLGCQVQTGNKAFWDVVYGESDVQIVADLLTIDIDVDSSNLYGVQGEHYMPEDLDGNPHAGQLVENLMAGEMSIWGQTFDLPIEDDTDGLDPDYDRAEFLLSDECRENIAVPINYECGY